MASRGRRRLARHLEARSPESGDEGSAGHAPQAEAARAYRGPRTRQTSLPARQFGAQALMNTAGKPRPENATAQSSRTCFPCRLVWKRFIRGPFPSRPKPPRDRGRVASAPQLPQQLRRKGADLSVDAVAAAAFSPNNQSDQGAGALDAGQQGRPHGAIRRSAMSSQPT
jgi:hypothetical protein